MKRTLKGLALTAMIALSLLASTSEAFAKEAQHGRETAWTLPVPPDLLESIPADGVTWE